MQIRVLLRLLDADGVPFLALLPRVQDAAFMQCQALSQASYSFLNPLQPPSTPPPHPTRQLIEPPPSFSYIPTLFELDFFYNPPFCSFC